MTSSRNCCSPAITAEGSIPSCSSPSTKWTSTGAPVQPTLMFKCRRDMLIAALEETSMSSQKKIWTMLGSQCQSDLSTFPSWSCAKTLLKNSSLNMKMKDMSLITSLSLFAEPLSWWTNSSFRNRIKSLKTSLISRFSKLFTSRITKKY